MDVLLPLGADACARAKNGYGLLGLSRLASSDPDASTVADVIATTEARRASAAGTAEQEGGNCDVRDPGRQITVPLQQ